MSRSRGERSAQGQLRLVFRVKTNIRMFDVGGARRTPGK